MNDKEKLENIMNFVTIIATNVLTLAKECKDLTECNAIKKKVADFCLSFNNNLRELITHFEKEEENGSIEH